VKTIVARCAALDVHKDSISATASAPRRGGGRGQHQAEFGTTAAQLLALRDWLAAHKVTQVAMEATGIYWRPVWAVLEDEFELLLVNARHVKQVPGRTTDVLDAQWLCQLLEAGLLRASLVPPQPIRTLRNLTRYRKTQIQARQRETLRLHKAIEDTGIKLGCVASDIMGRSGRAMLDALVGGTTDPEVLADLARGQLRAKLPAFREALEGRFDAEHQLLIGQMLAHIDFLDEAIDRLSDAIEEQIAPFAAQRDLLMTIPGVKQRTAEVLLAEIGIDMTVFPSAAHLASWAGVCPGNDQSAGKRRSGRPKGLQVAARDPDRVLAGGHPQEGHLPLRALPTAARAPWPQQGAHGGEPLDPRRGLAHAQHRRDLSRGRSRLLHPPEPRPRRPRPHPKARGPRPPRHDRALGGGRLRRFPFRLAALTAAVLAALDGEGLRARGACAGRTTGACSPRNPGSCRWDSLALLACRIREPGSGDGSPGRDSYPANRGSHIAGGHPAGTAASSKKPGSHVPAGSGRWPKAPRTADGAATPSAR
jgi:transposase